MPNRPTIEVTDKRTGSLICTAGFPLGMSVEACKRAALTEALQVTSRDWDWDRIDLDGPPSIDELEVREVGATVVCEGEAA